MNGRKWRPEEDHYLLQHCYRSTYADIGRVLGRTYDAVRSRANDLGVGCRLYMGGSAVTMRMITKAFHKSHSEQTLKHFRRCGAPLKRVRYGSRTFWVITPEDMWAHFRDHPTLWPMARLEPLALGPEPDWVAEARTRTRTWGARKAHMRWTTAEEMLLISMARSGAHVNDICRALSRPESGVVNRARSLGVRIRMDYYKLPPERWDELRGMVSSGASIFELADRLGISVGAVRNTLRSLYGTASAEQARLRGPIPAPDKS